MRFSTVHLSLFLVLFFVCGSSRSAPPRSATEKMVDTLKHLLESENPKKDVLTNKKRALMFREQLDKSGLDVKHRNSLKIRLNLAYELLQAGETESAIKEYKILLEHADLIPTSDLSFAMWENFPPMKRILKTFLGICYLRLGEQQNCVGGHNHASCIFPIKGKGIHMRKEGSEKAIEIFTELFKEHPTDIKVRWLLNLAYMTLGQYPDKVPKDILYSPELFASEKEWPTFVDIAPQSGVSVLRGAGSVVMDDFNQDGHLDLILSSPRLDAQLKLFKNNGKNGSALRFTDYTATSGLVGITDGKNLVQGDFDNDGCLDLYLTRGAYKGDYGLHPNSLLKNLCDGRFEDVTEKSGILRFAPTYTAAWWDYDNDGWLDLFVPHQSGAYFDVYHPMADTPKPRGAELWRNNGNGTFTDVAKSVGLDVSGNFKGALWGDYDNDGRGDLFLTEVAGQTRLFRNEGPDKNGTWRFRNVIDESGIGKDKGGANAMFFDFDNDGDEDLFFGFTFPKGKPDGRISLTDSIIGYKKKFSVKRPFFYINNGNGTFSEASEHIGLSQALQVMGMNYGDLDNDGFLEIYLGTGAPPLSYLIPNRMFWNDQGRRFLDITTAGGFGHLQKGHGIAFGDLDGDGSQDVFAQMGGAFEGDEYWTALFKNPGTKNHWLKIKLKGNRSNRAGVGARIKVTIKDKKATRTVHRTVRSGGTRGSSPLEQHIGTGTATVVEKIEVFWPGSGTTTLLEKVKTDQSLLIEEK